MTKQLPIMFQVELPQKQIRKVGRYGHTCSRCQGPLEDHRIGRQSYCLKCHAWYMRCTRPKHSELAEPARKKANARAYAHVYRDRGVIRVEGCKVCGEKAQMHHTDYSKPLQVTWLCRKHHLELHRTSA